MSTIGFQTSKFGVPDFRVIDIDPAAVAQCLQAYVDRGSRLTGVSLDDIQLGVTRVPQNIRTATLTDLLAVGMKLFDAIVWLTAGSPTSHPLVADPNMTDNQIPSMMSVARSVFYTYFFLLTQARYPASRQTTDIPKTPNFLSVVMGMDEPQHAYIDRICSFNPTQFDPRWVQSVQFAGLGQESLSRFGLGVAGYRMFGPFKLITPSQPVPQNLQNAMAFARNIAVSAASWQIHPLTRSPNILQARGNLNKNLGNLILDVFTDAEIDMMVQARILFKKPEREPAYTNYQEWNPVNDIATGAYIFS